MPADASGYKDGLGDCDVSKRVVDIIDKTYNILRSCIYRSSTLSGDLGGDSMNQLSLAFGIEEGFDEIEDNSIPDEVINSWKTVGQVVEYVQSRAGVEKQG
jgi:acyl carrier protein